MQRADDRMKNYTYLTWILDNFYSYLLPEFIKSSTLDYNIRILSSKGYKKYYITKRNIGFNILSSA